MEKQVLTHERILQDFKDNSRGTLKVIVRLLIILICVFTLTVYLTIRILEDGFDFYVILVDLVIALWIGVGILGIIGYFRRRQDIEQGNFYVVTDELVAKQEPESYRSVPFLWVFSKTAKLKFYAYGSISMISDHTASNPDPYAVSDTDNYFSSSVGDKFLLVVTKKSHLLLAYNTKWFEYHE